MFDALKGLIMAEAEQQGRVELKISFLNEKHEIVASASNVFTVRDDSSVTEGQSSFADDRVYLPPQAVFFPEH